MKQTICIMAVLLSASCGPGENDSGPGGVTVGEARALDDAAEMLEQRRSEAESLPVTDAPADEAVPEPNSSEAEPDA